MSRSFRYTPIAFYHYAGPGFMRFFRRETQRRWRAQVRMLMAAEHYDDIDTRMHRPPLAMLWEPREGRHWWSKRVVLGQWEHKDYSRRWRRGVGFPIVEDPVAEELSRRRKWMRK